jgi:hypothetical protein
MKLDRKKVFKSLVRVFHSPRSWGMGFFVTERHIITAAHCLPSPPKTVFDDGVTTRVRRFSGNVQAQAVVVDCDVLCDLAILSNEPRAGGDFPNEWREAFWALSRKATPLPIDFSAPQSWNSRLKHPIRVHVPTHDGTWVSGVIKFLSPDSDLLALEYTGDGRIKGGTSGAPALTDEGKVMGVVSQTSEGGGYDTGALVYLMGALRLGTVRAFQRLQDLETGTSSAR